MVTNYERHEVRSKTCITISFPNIGFSSIREEYAGLKGKVMIQMENNPTKNAIIGNTIEYDSLEQYSQLHRVGVL